MSSESKDGSTNIIVESWDPLDPSQPSIHHLPFKIAHTGHANVSKYLILKEKTIEGHHEGALASSAPISTWNAHLCSPTNAFSNPSFK